MKDRITKDILMDDEIEEADDVLATNKMRILDKIQRDCWLARHCWIKRRRLNILMADMF